MGIESENIREQMFAAARKAWDGHHITQAEDVAMTAWTNYKPQDRIIQQQADIVGKEAWDKHPTTQIENTLRQAWSESRGRYSLPIDWQEEVGLYFQAEVLLTQLINVDRELVRTPPGVYFSKQLYDSGKIGASLSLSCEGLSKELADKGIAHVCYQNQPQLAASQSGEIRWLKIDWNNTGGDPMQEVYEFKGLSVKKQVLRFKNGMPRTETTDKRPNGEDLILVRTILDSMFVAVERLTVGR